MEVIAPGETVDALAGLGRHAPWDGGSALSGYAESEPAPAGEEENGPGPSPAAPAGEPGIPSTDDASSRERILTAAQEPS